MRSIPTFTDAALSVWQSAIHAVVQRHEVVPSTALSANHPLMIQAVAAGQKHMTGAPVLSAGACPVDGYADLATRLAVALFHGNRRQADEIRKEFEYSHLDPLWLECLAEYEKTLALGMAVPYCTYDPARIAADFVLPLPEPRQDSLVIAVIGDWGTGTQDAKELLAAVAAHEPDLLLHLGDIYYSGTATECRQHFYDPVTALWPGASGPGIPVYSLSGNHDLYSGGDGYYQLLDQLGQPASFFCLRNEHWQLLALDTGLHEHDAQTADSCVTFVEPSEVLWHQDKIRNASGRKTILLSHHQPFGVARGGVGLSADGRPLAVNPNLWRAISENGVSPRDISLWLWGHEHNLVVYEAYGGLARGRCIGAGAIPVGAEEDPYRPDPNLLAPPEIGSLPSSLAGVRLGHDDEVYNRCYATLTLSGPAARMDYYEYAVETSTGRLLYSETID
jgi:hypothetical protein